MHQEGKFDSCVSPDKSVVDIFKCCEETYKDNPYFTYDCQFELVKDGCDDLVDEATALTPSSDTDTAG